MICIICRELDLSNGNSQRGDCHAIVLFYLVARLVGMISILISPEKSIVSEVAVSQTLMFKCWCTSLRVRALLSSSCALKHQRWTCKLDCYVSSLQRLETSDKASYLLFLISNSHKHHGSLSIYILTCFIVRRKQVNFALDASVRKTSFLQHCFVRAFLKQSCEPKSNFMMSILSIYVWSLKVFSICISQRPVVFAVGIHAILLACRA